MNFCYVRVLNPLISFVALSLSLREMREILLSCAFSPKVFLKDSLLMCEQLSNVRLGTDA